MKTILLNGKEIETPDVQSLPMLVHGKEGSGASLYTICLAAKWFTQGARIMFLCGYEMAEQEFNKEVGPNHPNAKFFTKEKLSEFLKDLKHYDTENTIVFIKNVELFDMSLFNSTEGIQRIVISGDFENSHHKDILLGKTFSTEVYFSPLEGKSVPQLEKYQGYVVSKDYNGVTSLG